VVILLLGALIKERKQKKSELDEPVDGTNLPTTESGDQNG
jgi:hypothetical protein